MERQFSIYVLTDCPYCKRAVSLLEEKNYPFILIVMDKNPGFVNQIKQQTGHKTVPIVIEHTQQDNNKLIGGCDNLETYLTELKDGN
jgi:glutaredoxin 3